MISTRRHFGFLNSEVRLMIYIEERKVLSEMANPKWFSVGAESTDNVKGDGMR